MQKFKYYVHGTGDIDLPNFQSYIDAENFCYDFIKKLHITTDFYANGGLIITKAISSSVLQEFTEDDTPVTYKSIIMLPID